MSQLNIKLIEKAAGIQSYLDMRPSDTDAASYALKHVTPDFMFALYLSIKDRVSGPYCNPNAVETAACMIHSDGNQGAINHALALQRPLPSTFYRQVLIVCTANACNAATASEV